MASPFDSQYSSIRSRIEHYADLYGIDRNLGIWQIWQESRFNPRACSNRNACGIAQFIPDTAARFGVNRNDIDSSLDGWGQYMRLLLSMFNGRNDIALAAYNSGENRAEYRNAAAQGRDINWSIMPGNIPSETRNYVRIIMGNAGLPIGAGGSDYSSGTTADDSSGGGGSSSNFAIYAALGLLFVVLVAD